MVFVVWLFGDSTPAGPGAFDYAHVLVIIGCRYNNLTSGFEGAFCFTFI